MQYSKYNRHLEKTDLCYAPSKIFVLNVTVIGILYNVIVILLISLFSSYAKKAGRIFSLKPLISALATKQNVCETFKQAVLRIHIKQIFESVLYSIVNFTA